MTSLQEYWNKTIFSRQWNREFFSTQYRLQIKPVSPSQLAENFLNSPLYLSASIVDKVKTKTLVCPRLFAKKQSYSIVLRTASVFTIVKCRTIQRRVGTCS